MTANHNNFIICTEKILPLERNCKLHNRAFITSSRLFKKKHDNYQLTLLDAAAWLLEAVGVFIALDNTLLVS